MLVPEAQSVFLSGSGADAPWPALLAVWGAGGASGLHAHHTWHLMVALEGTLAVRAAREAPERCAPALLTRPDVPHAIDARGAKIVMVFVDPESAFGARLDAVHREPIALFSKPRADALKELFRDRDAQGPAHETLTRVLIELGVGAEKPVLRHRAIRRVLRHLREHPEDDQSLESLAAIAGLSSSRFMHLFTEEVGIPLRPYLRWQKLTRAAALIGAGTALSEAAHQAGFADAAHMTRSFRAMFGTTPSELRQNQQRRP